MKTSIIFLGLVALTFTTNTKAATEFKSQDLNQQELTTISGEDNQQSQWVLVNQANADTATANNADDTVIFNPNSVVSTTYVKTIEDTIAENKLITESQDLINQPLSIEKTFQDYINEDNQIIESTVSTEVYPLDFEKINRTLKNNKVPNNTMAVTVDLKL